MTAWKRIAAVAIVSVARISLVQTTSVATEFEPLNLSEIGRLIGFGFGPGYHARPCNLLRRAYYNCVTEGAAPFGQSDVSLESYDHTHPNIAWRFPVNGQCGCESCLGGIQYEHEPTDLDFSFDNMNKSEDAQENADRKTDDSDDDEDSADDGSDERKPTTKGIGPDAKEFLPPKQRMEDLPDPSSPSPSDSSYFTFPPLRQTNWQRPVDRPRYAADSPRQATQTQRQTRYPDPVWVRNLPSQTLPTRVQAFDPRMTPVRAYPVPPRSMTYPSLSHPSMPNRPMHLATPPQASPRSRTAKAPVDFVWH